MKTLIKAYIILNEKEKKSKASSSFQSKCAAGSKIYKIKTKLKQKIN